MAFFTRCGVDDCGPVTGIDVPGDNGARHDLCIVDVRSHGDEMKGLSVLRHLVISLASAQSAGLDWPGSERLRRPPGLMIAAKGNIRPLCQYHDYIACVHPGAAGADQEFCRGRRKSAKDDTHRVKLQTLLFTVMGLVMSPSAWPGVEPTPVVAVDAAKHTISAQAPLVDAVQPADKGPELRFAISNGGFSPVTAVLKAVGLTEASYDIYASGAYLGSFTREKLAAGVPLKISAGALDAHTRMVLETLVPLLGQATDVMIADPLNWPFPAEFRDAHTWARGLMQQDLRARTAYVSLVKDGRAPEAPVTAPYVMPKDIVTSAKDLLADLERLRGDIQKRKMAPETRAKHFGWILPVKVDLQTPDGGQTACKAVITNYDSRTVKGSLQVTPAASAGAPGTCAFNLAPGKSASCQILGCGQALVGALTGQAGEFKFTRAIDFAREDSVNAEAAARTR